MHEVEEWKKLDWFSLPIAVKNAVYFLLEKLNVPFDKEDIEYIAWNWELIEVNGLFYGAEWIEDSYNWWYAKKHNWDGKDDGYITSDGSVSPEEPEKEILDICSILDIIYEHGCIHTPLRVFHETLLHDIVVQEICKKLPEWLKGIETSEGTIIDVEVVKTPTYYDDIIRFGVWYKDPCESIIEIVLSENKGYLKFKLDPQNKGSEKCVFEDTLEVFDEEIPVEVNIYS